MDLYFGLRVLLYDIKYLPSKLRHRAGSSANKAELQKIEMQIDETNQLIKRLEWVFTSKGFSGRVQKAII